MNSCCLVAAEGIHLASVHCHSQHRSVQVHGGHKHPGLLGGIKHLHASQGLEALAAAHLQEPPVQDSGGMGLAGNNHRRYLLPNPGLENLRAGQGLLVLIPTACCVNPALQHSGREGRPTSGHGGERHPGLRFRCCDLQGLSGGSGPVAVSAGGPLLAAVRTADDAEAAPERDQSGGGARPPQGRQRDPRQLVAAEGLAGGQGLVAGAEAPDDVQPAMQKGRGEMRTPRVHGWEWPPGSFAGSCGLGSCCPRRGLSSRGKVEDAGGGRQHAGVPLRRQVYHPLVAPYNVDLLLARDLHERDVRVQRRDVGGAKRQVVLDLAILVY
mmetsp:Transcript_47697/g.149946  ORF Transcript_47697/g.149946 Transcript_47697/m.149946 type:complete len:325 (+) Transcript_47697:204-1178(+)